LCLSGCLGSPSDDSNILDALECLGKKREKVSSSLDNGLCGISELDFYRLEDIGGETMVKKVIS
jgi:hypothetical protein